MRLALLYSSILLVLIVASTPTKARADVTGVASVIDGDTLEIGGERIRLEGIDEPEKKQACSAYGEAWPCGQMAADWLRTHLRDREVTCVGHDRDRYHRLLAVCYVGGEDLNERIVTEGWALDFRRYTNAYLPAEAEARRRGAGLWRGEFVPPWEWRKGTHRV
jgi:endonuclease YncB( thermonuclease family)